MIRALLLLMLLSFISITAQAFQDQSEKEIDPQRLEFLADSVANKIIGMHEVPGMAVAVAQEGKILFRKNYGRSDIEMNVEVNDSTIFGLASITKQYTAATIMRLVDQGKISLDDSITKFLPDYPSHGNNVTIHHLLSHTSGLQDYGFKNDELPGWFTLKLSHKEMMDLWGNRAVNYKPGEDFDYNNWGYYLLGQIIEKVTGTPWIHYAEPELLQPLGLNNTLFAHQLRIVPNRAKGYVKPDYFIKNKVYMHETINSNDSLINVYYRNVETFAAGGGLSATIEDLVSWTHQLHNGKVVSTESYEKMTSPTVLNNGEIAGYGYGLYVNELRGHRKIYHGGTFGFGTFVTYYPEDKISIAILSNSTKGRDRAEELEKILATEALNIKIKDLPLSAEDVNRYSGVYPYQSTPTKVSELKVFGENGKLMAQFSGGKPFLLRYQGNHKFIPKVDGITNINFEIKEGKAVGLTIHEGAWEVTKAERK